MSAGAIRTISLAGSPRERGRIHGETLRAEIVEHMGLWAETCRKETGMESSAYLAKFYRETDFLPAAQRHTPDILEEVRGIAEGSGLPFELVLVRQLSDEEPWYRKCLEFGIDVTEHCSAAGRRGGPGEPNLVAQNMDSPPYYDGFQMVARVKEEDGETESLILTLTGKLSLCGMNNHGVAICCNSIPQLRFDRRGLAEDFIVRRVLQLRTMREAMVFLMTAPHASGQNYLVGGPDGVVDLECSAGGAVEFLHDAPDGRLWHTNHPIVNHDTELWESLLAGLKRSEPERHAALLARMTTFRRLEVLERKVRGAPRLDLDALQDILLDREAPLCLGSKDDLNFTLATVAMVCEAERPRMLLASAPFRGAAWESFGF